MKVNFQRHLISRSTLRIFRAEATAQWQDAVADRDLVAALLIVLAEGAERKRYQYGGDASNATTVLRQSRRRCACKGFDPQSERFARDSALEGDGFEPSVPRGAGSDAGADR
jgi:hypothetical protein